MRHAIATVSLSGLLADKLRAAADAGFAAVELFEPDLLAFPGSPEDVRAMAADLGLAIDLLQPFRDFEAASPAQQARNLDRAERKFDLMQRLGAGTLLVCSSVQPDAPGEPDELAAQFARLAERAAARGLVVGYEALAWGTRTRRWSEAWEVVRRVGHPALGLVLDSFHTLALRDDWAALARLPAGKIAYLQLADAPWVPTDVLTHSRHHRCFPGQGELDVAGMLAAILATGWVGTLSLEVFNDEFRAAPAFANAHDARRSLLWLEDQAAARLAPRGDGAAPARAAPLELFSPPDAPPPADWAFVEFAADDATAERLQQHLARLGFAELGRHRQRAIRLLGLGDVRLVINGEADSPAREHFARHGVSVCALALATADPAATLARARAYGYAPAAEASGSDATATRPARPGTLDIPAVRAPDASMLHFCRPAGCAPLPGSAADAGHFERFFAGAALAAAQAAPGAAGHAPAGGIAGARIDHVAQAVPGGDKEPWLLFLRAVLGLAPRSTTVLNDPFGVIRARELATADGAVRWSLTVSDRQDTAVSRSVARFAGAGVHQIAVHVPDLLAWAEAALARGAPLLPVPANWYEDLAARAPDLPAARLERLARCHVMLDRDGEGREFLHAYAEPFDERFEFEFVQRAPGYTGYGSANAGVHLAALAARRAQPAPG